MPKNPVKVFFEAPLHVPSVGLETFCSNALRSLGCEVILFEFWKPLFRSKEGSGRTVSGDPDPGRGPVVRGLRRSWGHTIPGYRYLKVRVNERRLGRALQMAQPDLWFVLGGKTLPPEVVLRMRRRFGLKTALWANDDPQLFHLTSRFAHAYSQVFTDDGHSVSLYKDIGVDAEVLSFGCDPSYHKKVEVSFEERRRFGSNLVFCGTLYSERIRCLETVADLGLAIWSRNPDQIRNHPKLWDCYRGAPNIEELTKIYNASKILLNPHLKLGRSIRERGTWANLRLFEAAGCGIFQITDRKPMVEESFTPGREIACFDTPEEIRELARKYLANSKEREAMAEAAFQRAHREYTFVHRMRWVFSKLGYSI